MAKKGMNVSEVDSLLRRLETEANELDTLTGKVKNLESPLISVWEGQEAEACVDYLKKLASTMLKMRIEIMKIHKWAKQTRDNYKDAADKGKRAYTI